MVPPRRAAPDHGTTANDECPNVRAIDLSEVRPPIAQLPASRRWHLSVLYETETVLALPEKQRPVAEGPGKVLESPGNEPGEASSEVEKAMIHGALQVGKGKTESLQALKRYSGRRHQLYSAAWEEARVNLQPERR